MYRFISKQIKNKNIKILKGIPFKNTQSFVNIKTIVFSIFCITLLFTSCVKEDDVQEIPAYIKVTDFNFNPQLDGYAIKQPVFSFNKFPNVDKTLGPEMKSTGESILFIENLKDDEFYNLYSKRKMYLSK